MRERPGLRERLVLALQRRWYADAAPPRALRAAERIYRALIRERLARPAARPPCPVIVVGNLVAGGSGKTPVVAALARLLVDAGCRVAIVSRGYGGAEPRRAVRVAPGSTVAEVGDEALELSTAAGCPVWVCANRARALDAARASGAGVVLADDGLQHTALPRSLEICVVDARRAFGNGHLLPAGPLRQPLVRLSEVDLVLIKTGFGAERPDLPDGERFELVAERLRPVQAGRDVPVPQPPCPVDAVAGIADPESFFALLETLGYRVRRHPLADHARLDPAWLSALPGPVVVTRKDAMRLPDGVGEDVFVLPVTARLPRAVGERVLAHVREFRP